MFQNIIHIVKKQVIFLMIPIGEGWHYFSLEKLSALLRRITSKHNSDFHCLNCLHSSAAEKNVNLIKKYVKIKTFVTL